MKNTTPQTRAKTPRAKTRTPSVKATTPTQGKVSTSAATTATAKKTTATKAKSPARTKTAARKTPARTAAAVDGAPRQDEGAIKRTSRKAYEKVSETVSRHPGKVAAAAGVATAAALAGVVASKKLSNRAPRKVSVQPDGDRWQIMVEGNERPTRTFALKRDAIEAGREIARKRLPSELVIFRADGSEQTRHEYSA